MPRVTRTCRVVPLRTLDALAGIASLHGSPHQYLHVVACGLLAGRIWRGRLGVGPLGFVGGSRPGGSVLLVSGYHVLSIGLYGVKLRWYQSLADKLSTFIAMMVAY